jgi:cell division protein FtsB
LPRRRLVFLAALLAAALIGSAFARVTLQDNALGREALGVRGQIAMLEAEQSYLRAQIATRETRDYIVTKARDYGYVQQGEGLASVRDASPRQSLTPEAPDPRQLLVARIQRWIALFFHQ